MSVLGVVGSGASFRRITAGIVSSLDGVAIGGFTCIAFGSGAFATATTTATAAAAFAGAIAGFTSVSGFGRFGFGASFRITFRRVSSFCVFGRRGGARVDALRAQQEDGGFGRVRKGFQRFDRLAGHELAAQLAEGTRGGAQRGKRDGILAERDREGLRAGERVLEILRRPRQEEHAEIVGEDRR